MTLVVQLLAGIVVEWVLMVMLMIRIIISAIKIQVFGWLSIVLLLRTTPMQVSMPI